MAIKRPDERLYDVRLRTRLLNTQIITEQEVDKYISKLPDVEENVEPSEVELGPKTGPDL